ncbi:MAG: hypothetical protein ACFFBQ_10435 [Promethearchaeota archaeon]
MSKTERHRCELEILFSDFFQTKDYNPLMNYLTRNSNLPGRRANLELAKAFTMVIEDNWKGNEELIWKFITILCDITPNQAPTNDPKEFLPFCATWTLGSIGVISKSHYKEVFYRLKELANDSRWRIREAVAKGIHRLIEENYEEATKELATWILKNQYLLMRAVVTGVAEPNLLKNDQMKKQALTLHKEVFNEIMNRNDEKTDEFNVLKKGLAYSLSVVVQAIPEEGFRYMEELTTSQDKDIKWILKQNLKKNRLSKNFQATVRVLSNKLK